MKFHKIHRHLTLGMAVILVLATAGCSSGYRIQRNGSTETLYNIGKNGKQIVYVLDKEGSLKIHDVNDPIVKRFFDANKMDDQIQQYFRDLNAQREARLDRLIAAKLVKTGRIAAAPKRAPKDPVLVRLHDAELGPRITKFTRGVTHTQARFNKIITKELTAGAIIRISEDPADINISFKGYFKETPAMNVETHKLVTVTAFHFEALVQSNYLDEENFVIKELGHWMESTAIIERTARRINKIIIERIGPNIPKERLKYLSTPSQGV